MQHVLVRRQYDDSEYEMTFCLPATVGSINTACDGVKEQRDETGVTGTLESLDLLAGRAQMIQVEI